MKKLILATGVISCLSFGALDCMVPAGGVQAQQWAQQRAREIAGTRDILRQMILSIGYFDRDYQKNYLELLKNDGMPVDAILASEEDNWITVFKSIPRRFKQPEQLFIWCLSKNSDLVSCLLTGGFNDDISKFDSTLLMMYAYATGNLDTVRLLESLGCELDPKAMSSKFINPKGEFRACNILLPATIGGLDTLHYLLKSGVNIFSTTGWPGIDSIVVNFGECEREDLLVYFMKQDYDLLSSSEGTIQECKCINYRNEFHSLLFYILSYGFPNALNLFMNTVKLLPKGDQIPFLQSQSIGARGETILHTAATNPKAMKLLAQHRDFLNQCCTKWRFLQKRLNSPLYNDEDEDPNTPWKIFVEEGNYENIQPVLQYVLSDEFAEWQGFTELHKLVLLGDPEALVDYLTSSQGIDINAKDRNQNTAIHLAASFGLQDIVHILLCTEGIELNDEGQDEKRPIEMAIKSGNSVVVDLLLADERFIEAYPDHTYTLVSDAMEKENKNMVISLLSNPRISIDDEVFEVIFEESTVKWDMLSLLLQREDINVSTKCDYNGRCILEYALKSLAKAFMKSEKGYIGDRTREILIVLGEHCKEASIVPDEVVSIMGKVMNELGVKKEEASIIPGKVVSILNEVDGLEQKGEIDKAQLFTLSVLGYLCPDDENDYVPNMYEFLQKTINLPNTLQASLLVATYGCQGSVSKLMPIIDFMQCAQEKSYTTREMIFSLLWLYNHHWTVKFLPDIRELLTFLQGSRYPFSVQRCVIHIAEKTGKKQAGSQPTTDEVIDFLISNRSELDPLVWLFAVHKYGGYDNHSELVPAINDFITNFIKNDDDPEQRNDVIEFLKISYKSPKLSDHLCDVPVLLQAMKVAGLGIETQLDILNDVYKTSGRFAELLPDPNDFNQFVEKNLTYNSLDYLRLLICLYGIQNFVSEGIPDISELMIEFMQQGEYDLKNQLDILRELYVHPEIEELQEFIPDETTLQGFMQFMLELGYDQQSQIDILRVLYAEREMDANKLQDIIPFMREKEYNLETQLNIISILFSFSDPNDLIEFIRLTGYNYEAKRIFEDLGLGDFYKTHKGIIAHLLRQ